ncbi:hypothetical protein LMG28614_06186 [Paraburkholderia ultramafica]|uniref:Secreted protein n=1 Tax=Paraburkholderia ultramafica TaxID=1544867 RepID=A0A6S7BLX5_9BURK|nr:hypothetical protein LMG28614_06186 [Paraburkholderia ultramafica]
MQRYILHLAFIGSICTFAQAAPLADNPCGVPDAEALARQPVCTDLSCVPSRNVQSERAIGASKCEFERLQPPALGLAPPAQVSGHL